MNKHIASLIIHMAAAWLLVPSLALARPVDPPNAAKPTVVNGIKDYGLKEYLRLSKDLPHAETNAWKLVCRMPYNCHFQPWIQVESPEGNFRNARSRQTSP